MARLALILFVFLCPQLAYSWIDAPLQARTTPIRAPHINELRTEINAKRVACGLAPTAWTYPVLTPGVTSIHKVDVDELRSSVQELYAQHGSTLAAFTDAVITARQTAIKATHIEEIRAACDGVTWCGPPLCECGGWTDAGGCGAGGCANDQKPETRSCLPGGCDTETRCKNDNSCGCNCGAWSEAGGCGDGGCANDQKPETRSCVPGGCNNQNRCKNDNSCACTADGGACGSNGDCCNNSCLNGVCMECPSPEPTCADLGKDSDGSGLSDCGGTWGWNNCDGDVRYRTIHNLNRPEGCNPPYCFNVCGTRDDFCGQPQ